MISLYKLTRTTIGTAKRVLLAQLRGAGATGDDDHAEGSDENEIYHPLGFVARPDPASEPEGLEALVFDDTDQLGVLAIVNKLLAVFSPAIEEGETRLYGAKLQGVYLRLRADGSADLVTVDGKDIRLTVSGTGKVVVKGGTTPVAVEGSTATHTHGFGSYQAGPYAVTGVSGSTAAAIDAGQGAQKFVAPAAGT